MLTVKRKVGQLDGCAAGGEQDAAGGDHTVAVLVMNFDRVWILNACQTLNGFNFIFPEQTSHAGGHGFYDFVLPLHHGGDINLGIVHLNAVPLE